MLHPMGLKKSDTTEQLNNTTRIVYSILIDLNYYDVIVE